jgi:hypothetical protein
MSGWGVPLAPRGMLICSYGTKYSAIVRRGVARMVRVVSSIAWRRKDYGAAAVALDACEPKQVCVAKRGGDSKRPPPQGQPRRGAEAAQSSLYSTRTREGIRWGPYLPADRRRLVVSRRRPGVGLACCGRVVHG